MIAKAGLSIPAFSVPREKSAVPGTSVALKAPAASTTKPDHPGVPNPRQEEQDADGGEQPGEDGRAVARAVGPAAEQRMDEGLEDGAHKEDRPHRCSTPSEPVQIQRYKDGQRAE